MLVLSPSSLWINSVEGVVLSSVQKITEKWYVSPFSKVISAKLKASGLAESMA